MRFIILLSLFSLVALMVACSESFTDPRDGQSYDIVQIGSQTWMAENLNYEIEGSACPEGDNRNCSKYGRLYNWDMARTVCPEGWRLPDSADFEQLIASAGGMDFAGEKLKSTSGWFKKGNGTDDYGFNALPAGYRLGGSESAPGKFDGIGGYAHLWSAVETPDGLAYYMLLDFSIKAAKLSAFGKDEARSVRCVK
ncbi:major paralogous domain-containing protein [Fibrobacter sp. UWOV1]|uniref:fibrobacter succinogenes major paralogous domain-containing protein n=1 Tax=Fibrobacter sp. UWOV1 TaxID=1896215 RepID=UPI00091C189C|nr:fibrobacter succinogenes major paralogous domain-containing protein [Fibrobacter sp. UWOV1]SHL69085.1 major paralogous domain-containing protein [Fibrobacter sp. UWOV1]